VHHLLPVTHTHDEPATVHVPTPRAPLPLTAPAESVPAMTFPAATHSTSDSPPTDEHLLRLDYTNKSAQIINPAGDCVAIYSHLGGRDAAVARVAADGWHLAPGGQWRTTTPPDGREHPIIHREDVSPR